MVQKILNKVVELEKDKEVSSSGKPFRQFFKKKEENSPPQPPTDNSSVLNIPEFGMDNFCTFHQQPHSVDLFNEPSCESAIICQLTEPEVKEEKETKK